MTTFPEDALVTFDEARAIALDELTKRGIKGTPYVDTVGRLDDEWVLVNAGAREFIVDGDDDFLELTGTSMIVDRMLGITQNVSHVENLERFAAMREVTTTR